MPALRSPKGKGRAVDPPEDLPSHSQRRGHSSALLQQDQRSPPSRQTASESIFSESARNYTSPSSSQTASSLPSSQESNNLGFDLTPSQLEQLSSSLFSSLSSQESNNLGFDPTPSQLEQLSSSLFSSLSSQESNNLGFDLTPSQLEQLSSSLFSSLSSQESNNLGFDLSSSQLKLLSPPYFSSPLDSPQTISAPDSTATNELEFFNEFLGHLKSGTEPTIPGIGKEEDFIQMPDRYLLNPPVAMGADKNDAIRNHILSVFFRSLPHPLVAPAVTEEALVIGSASTSAAIATSSTATAVSTIAEAPRYGIDMILTLYLKEAVKFNRIASKNLISSEEKVYKSEPMETQEGKNWMLDDFKLHPRPGCPPWLLKLKIGMPIVLLQSVKGLEAGTRLVVTELGDDRIRAKVVAMVSCFPSSPESRQKEAKAKARVISIKRRVYDTTTGGQGQAAEEKGEYKVHASRKQFPVKSAFALAICDMPKEAKFEGLGLDLDYSLESPGMLHDVLSRCRDPSRLKVFIPRGDLRAGRYTRNVVPVRE